MARIVVFIFSLFCFFLLPAQTDYSTSLNITFSGGNNGNFTFFGNNCGHEDISASIIQAEGLMRILVKDSCPGGQFMQYSTGNTASSPRLILKNRFFEMRIKSSAAVSDTGLYILFRPENSGISKNKTIPPLPFSIHKPNIWEVKFFTLGGDADTVAGSIEFHFPAGSYDIDYILVGDAAVPQAPVIEKISNMYIAPNQTISTPISVAIPLRITEGLAFSATVKDTSVISGLYFDGTNSCNPFVFCSYTRLFLTAMKTGSDSVIVAVSDTNRKTVATTAFVVFIYPEFIDETQEGVTVFPTVTNSFISIIFDTPFTGILEWYNQSGLLVFSEQIIHSEKTIMDISAFPAGIYFLKFSGETSFFVKKVIKQ